MKKVLKVEKMNIESAERESEVSEMGMRPSMSSQMSYSLDCEIIF